MMLSVLDKRRLVTLMLQKRGIGVARAEAIPRRSDSGPSPLSFSQEGMWFIDQFNPGRSTYNMPATVRLIGRLDVTALEQTLSEIVRRHESLRTIFTNKDGSNSLQS